MSDWPDHFCAACGAPQKPFPRYAWFLCRDCTRSAVAWDGRKLEFFNTHPSGGFGWAFEGDDVYYDQHYGAIALVAKRPALITEARFGGIVGQPLPDLIPLGAQFDKYVDLRRRLQSKEPLKPVPRRQT
ncbi:hypothetical protein [Yoonia sp. 208BN28-4]|uniref:hypothetical protein n=1 Tax=Yoonia sp. 208BN28-4 TaxID=3126505 RepID=UPI00309C373F